MVISAGEIGNDIYAKDLADKVHGEDNVQAICVLCGEESVDTTKEWVAEGDYSKVTYTGADYLTLTADVIENMKSARVVPQNQMEEMKQSEVEDEASSRLIIQGVGGNDPELYICKEDEYSEQEIKKDRDDVDWDHASQLVETVK